MFIVQQQVINHILGNGGSDPQNSGFIFHFQSYQQMITCRDSMRITVPAAFHNSPNLVLQINAMLPPNVPPLPAPVPMAEAWIVLKTAILSTDYKCDIAFFVIV